MARLQQTYQEKVVPELMSRFAYRNVMEVPRIAKISLNMGLGEAVADKKVIAVGTIDELLKTDSRLKEILRDAFHNGFTK